MAAAEDRAVIQLIDGDGDLDASAVETFVRSIRLNECGLSYAVVSIMGPQSSGKSTLLNHLFHTTFREMDALEGRSQTTKGVWLANCVGIEPCTIAMDLEGTDGRERGEDDTTFEKQSALFALAVSDVVLINMWCHDIGREQAANKPLLKTVFQVMLPLFSPRKTTLMFVIRDKTRTPLEILEPILIDDVQNIWNAIRKPEELKDAALNDFFTIEVVGLSSYEEKEEEFEEQVANLRKRFFNSIAPGGLAGDRRGVVPASGFSFSLQEIWKTIKGNKELDLPAHKVMVATVRCEEVANEKFASLSSDEHWLEFGEAAQTSFVPGFGKKLGSILNSCLSRDFVTFVGLSMPVYCDNKANIFLANNSVFDEHIKHIEVDRHFIRDVVLRGQITFLICLPVINWKPSLPSYDIETIYFDDDVRKRKREQLESKLLQLVYPAYMSVLGHLLSNTLNNFKVALEKALDSGQGFAAAAHDCSQSYMFAFDEKCADVAVEQANWDSSKVREELDHEIRAHINSVRSAKLAELHAFYMDQLKKALEEPVVSLLVSADDNTWPAIRKLLDHETKLAAASLSSALTAFDIHQATENEMLTDLRNYARKIVESKAKEEAGRVLIHIKERFSTIFSHDADSMPRIWTQKDNVKEITKTARLASLKLLSILSAVRLEEKADNIECTLSLSLLDNPKSSTTDRSISSLDQLVSGSWEEVPSSATLLTPVQCKSLWRQFNVETEYIISQAIAAKEANRLKNNQLPSAWVIALIAALGFNEFMYLLRRPWYVAILFVVYLLGKALWVQLDISHDLENGVLPGLISLVTKIVPVVTKILKRLADLGQQPAAPASG